MKIKLKNGKFAPSNFWKDQRLRQYKLFLDDSGTKEYNDQRKYSPESGMTEYFVFGGILLPTTVAGHVTVAMQNLKKAYFQRCDVEVKANWLRREIERRKRYLDPFSLTEEKLTAFADQVYVLLNGIECSLVACIVNKKEVQEAYEKPHYAPSIAYDCVLQRVQQEMESVNGSVHVTIDDMSGATPNKSQYKDNLLLQHKRLLTSGSPLRRGLKFDRIQGLSFSDSKCDERLQLADLVAYSVYKQFVDYGKVWEMDAENAPAYKYFRAIAGKFRKSDSGRIQGYGVVRFPLKRHALQTA